jgi:aldehyde oxidoreductase
VSGKATPRSPASRAVGANTWLERRRRRRRATPRCIDGARLVVTRPRRAKHRLDLAALPVDGRGDVAASGRFDPPTTPLDADGQGVPYATYGFAAQIAEVEVDLELGTVRVTRIVAAHDVGRSLNPTQVEGQIHGGIAQGLGIALMEEYRAGRTDNLHDYLIPTVGDVPPIETILIEDREPLGPGARRAWASRR